ncbi:hypothetical protein [Moritella sp.]|uniref:hypothetical protein n=1 Tax=Moritella sp. TaxID=78556 RepID=UPI001DE7B0CB|nr:hypothetical protein [Moritella sp.]MCJ8350451.1 hypothetical protein [Moritella sp.]NQZ40145.1 hypothetical protein [Moritella sp.]
MSLNKMTLDAMILGQDVDNSAWEALLHDSKREELWQAAVERREQINHFCKFAATWPKLAKSYRMMKSITKSDVKPPKLSCFDLFSYRNALQATMSGESNNGLDEFILNEIPWGSQRIVEIESPRHIKFKCERTINIYYEYDDKIGWITSEDSWELKQSEGPVILTFIDGEVNNDSSYSTAIEQANSVGGLVFLPNLK